ncbi:universal stress protein [Actinosynnema sp. NPDC047251]|uniref:universal stress protein n=1 Tax=Saccharothrix espanaensis TaxID=103731 RepID=UPI001E2A08A0|nr:universal stress protein [Saccharothrix espanaensis]
MGVDGSPAGRLALTWAMEEGRLRGVPVHALLVWDCDDGMFFGPVFAAVAAGADPGKLREKDRVLLDEIADRVGDDVHVEMADGPARDVLVRASANAVLLVVGKPRAGVIREALLGSLSSYCVRRAVCPVVVVREPEQRHVDPERAVGRRRCVDLRRRVRSGALRPVA